MQRGEAEAKKISIENEANNGSLTSKVDKLSSYAKTKLKNSPIKSQSSSNREPQKKPRQAENIPSSQNPQTINVPPLEEQTFFKNLQTITALTTSHQQPADNSAMLLFLTKRVQQLESEVGEMKRENKLNQESTFAKELNSNKNYETSKPKNIKNNYSNFWKSKPVVIAATLVGGAPALAFLSSKK